MPKKLTPAKVPWKSALLDALHFQLGPLHSIPCIVLKEDGQDTQKDFTSDLQTILAQLASQSAKELIEDTAKRKWNDETVSVPSLISEEIAKAQRTISPNPRGSQTSTPTRQHSLLSGPLRSSFSTPNRNQRLSPRSQAPIISDGRSSSKERTDTELFADLSLGPDANFDSSATLREEETEYTDWLRQILTGDKEEPQHEPVSNTELSPSKEIEASSRFLLSLAKMKGGF